LLVTAIVVVLLSVEEEVAVSLLEVTVGVPSLLVGVFSIFYYCEIGTFFFPQNFFLIKRKKLTFKVQVKKLKEGYEINNNKKK
jgi:ABC-type phosphate transport system permease subunit